MTYHTAAAPQRAGASGASRRAPPHIAAAIGMPTGCPELVTRKRSRAEWKLLATWWAELWPNDEYTAIVAEQWRQDRPPGTQGWR